MNDSVSANAMPATATALSAREGERIEPRWPAMMAFLTCGLRPATTARRTHHVSLKAAYAVHVAAALVGVLFIFALVSYADLWRPYSIGSFLDRLGSELGGALSYVRNNTEQTVGYILLVAALIEAFFVAVAVLVMPWGAKDEPLRSSFTNALRRTWLHTPHIALAILPAGALIAYTDRMRFPPGPGWRDLFEVISVHSVSASVGWLLWALLRGVGASRTTPSITRPPTCETCGYNLTTRKMKDLCPECGELVFASLGPASRRGTRWQRFAEGRRTRVWFACALAAVFRTPSFARRFTTVRRSTAHRRFFAWTLPVCFLIGICVPVGILYSLGQTNALTDPDLLFGLVPLVGAIATTAAIGLTLFSASVVGLFISFREKRNLLVGSMQTALYLAGFMVVWILFAGASGVATVRLADKGTLNHVADTLNMGRDELYFLVWLIPNTIWGIYYLILVARGTFATRYANR